MPYGNNVKITEKRFLGKKFGRLTVISYSHSKSQHSGYSRAYWNCICDCGKEVKVRSDHLSRGTTRSCGCLRVDCMSSKHGARVEVGSVPFNKLYNNYLLSAKERGKSFELTKEQFKDITSQNCYYCGAPPLSTLKVKSSYGEYVYNGIDRIDSNLGYVDGNVVPCCKTCNIAKSNMTLGDFLNWIVRVYSKSHESGLIVENINYVTNREFA